MPRKKSKGASKIEKALWKKVDSKEIHYENFAEGIEKFYFWVTDFMESTLHYKLSKIEDTSFASVGSSQWGLIEKRKSIQQDKAAQYMGTMGGMIKSMMQIYKELKIIDERLNYYSEADTGSVAAEIALKSLWIDLVEGGAKQPTSVLGLASQVGFVTLPDLFFNITPKDSKSVDKAVDNSKIETNVQVKNILKRKLKQYMTWRDRTKSELATRRYFNIKYLAQHFNVIKMYGDWAKPYLQNIGRLNQKVQEDYSYQLLEGSESTVADIELMGQRKIKERDTEFDKVFPIMVVNFHHRTRPVSAYQQEQHRGSLHIGRVEIKFTSYLANKKGLDDYKNKKKTETLKLLKTVDASMSALLDSPDSKAEFEGYLKEAEGIKEKQAEDEKKVKGKSSFGGFEIFIPEYFKKTQRDARLKSKSSKKPKRGSDDLTDEKSLAKIIAKEDVGTIFKTFKIVHGMLVRS